MTDSDGRYLPDVDTIEGGYGPTLRSFTVATPAAGVDWTFVVPGESCVRPVAVRAVLTTSAAVAVRAPRLVVDDQTDRYAEVAAGVTQAASLAGSWCWLDDWSGAGAAAGTAAVTAALPSFVLQPGWRVGTVTGGLDVGDQWSTVRVLAVVHRSFSPSLDRALQMSRRVGRALEAEYLLEGS